MDETLKIRLLKAVGNDERMREVLLEIMEGIQAEYCAFCTSRGRELVYILCESGELAARIPEIREKVRSSYRMFTNGLEPEREHLERIMFRRSEPSVLYLLANPKIESYFLVPLAFGSKVRGVLYVGSVRREAFGRNDIASLRGLAEEEGERSPLVYRVGGELDVLERLLSAIPLGAALVSGDGAIVGSNRAFAEILGIRDDTPGTVNGIGSLSLFSLQGIWDEFNILQREIVDRELKGSIPPERYLSVSCVRVEGLSENVGALLLVRDVTAVHEQAEMREEMIAMVAHELRTPLAALKNSLTIVAESEGESGCVGDGEAGRRFLANSLRTVERLGMLVDGLIDSSGARIDERALRIELRDMHSFLDEASSLFVEPMKKKGIGFFVSVDGDVGRLAFDRDRLEQVIQNLLANSIKHVPSGGTVSITVVPSAGCQDLFLPSALVRRVGAMAFADLCVRDTGSGIPSDVARRANRFERTAYRPIRASQGLGLRVAQRLVRLQGGSLVIEEGVVGGSAVHLYLPADKATYRVIQQYRSAEMRFEEMMSLGLEPVVHCLEKETEEPWEKALAPAKGGAAVNPHRSEQHDEELLVWPLDELFAIGIGSRDRAPGALPQGLRGGRSVARRDGMDLRDLVAASLAALEHEESVVAVKGETQ